MPTHKPHPCRDGHPEMNLLVEITSYIDRLPVMHCHRCGENLSYEDAIRNDERMKWAKAFDAEAAGLEQGTHEESWTANGYQQAAKDLRAAREAHQYVRQTLGVWLPADEPATGGQVSSIPLVGERQGSLVVNPAIPGGTVYAVGSCSCGHGVISHRENGCYYRMPASGDFCPCEVPVSRLATKATGMGEQP